MKKIIILLTTIPFFLTGCTRSTWAGIGKGTLGVLVVTGAVLEAHEDLKHNFDDYVVKHGVPTSSYTQANGITNYSFVKNCAHSHRQEEILVQVNENNRIIMEKTIRACPVS